jgi:hypothetical protein
MLHKILCTCKMALLFDPKCNSNPSILSISDMQHCSKLSLYVSISVFVFFLASLHIFSMEKDESISIRYLISLVTFGIILALLMTPLANLVGKRLKQSQMIDEQGLTDAGVAPINAKLTSFTDQSIRRLGSSASSSSPRANSTS